jgi:alpha-ketoglutarate-dependent taurine dioxygenase
MIDTKPVDFLSLDHVVKNIDKHKDEFIKNGIVVFRGANLSKTDHVHFNNVLSNFFGWHIHKHTEEDQPYSYTENHSSTENLKNCGGDDIALLWHLEHAAYKNPIVSGTWNMEKFDIDSENGKTYFVDSESIYRVMPDEWKTFLSVCLVKSTIGNNINYTTYSPVQEHWITKKEILRLNVNNVESGTQYTELVSVNDNDPSEDEVNLFNHITQWFSEQVFYNKDIRVVHRWKQGDLVLVDIFKMTHAVTGGFKPSDREFTGIWGYKDSISTI